MGNNDSNNFTFKVNVGKIGLQVSYYADTLHIKGSVLDSKWQDNQKTIQEDSLISYQAIYDWNSLPMEINKKFGSLKELAKHLQQNKKKLYIQNDYLVILSNGGYCFSSNKKCFLPLINTQAYQEMSLQNNEVIQPSHPIRKVKNTCRLPYSAAVLIMSQLKNSQRIATNQGTGVIISRTSVLTVAHNLYYRNYFLQVFQCYILVQTQKGLQKVKVKKWHLPNQYKTVSDIDRDRYDFAHLELEDNQIITQNHIIQLKWNLFNKKQSIEVIGFSNSYDLHLHNEKSNTMYHLRCDKIISIAEHFIKYNHSAQNGMSGGPIVILQQGKIKLIGLHQGLNIMSQGVLLTSFGKNPLQILADLSFSQKVLAAPLKNSQKDEEIKKLKQEIQKLNQEKQKMNKELQEKNKKLSEEKQKIKQFKKNNKKQSYFDQNKKEQGKQEKIENEIKKKQSIQCNNIIQIQNKDGGLIFLVQFKKDQGKLREFKKTETKIDLSKQKISDQQVGAICQLLPHLISLKLNQCQYIKKIYLNGCLKLEELQIKNSKMNLTDIRLENMPALKILNFQECLQLQSIKLANCPQLIDIDLSYTQIEDKDLSMLAQQCPKLKRLNLNSCKKITQFKNLSKSKQIAQLCLEQTNITDKSLSFIANQLTQLEVLNLNNCSKIKQTIKLKNCKKIKELFLGELNQYQDNLVQLLNQQFSQLVTLNLNGWKFIHISSYLFTNYTKLTKLNLRQTQITDADLQQLGTQVPQLQQIDLWECKNIVNPFLNNFYKLKKLKLQDSSVSKKRIKELLEKFPAIKISHFYFDL